MQGVKPYVERFAWFLKREVILPRALEMLQTDPKEDDDFIDTLPTKGGEQQPKLSICLKPASTPDTFEAMQTLYTYFRRQKHKQMGVKGPASPRSRKLRVVNVSSGTAAEARAKQPHPSEMARSPVSSNRASIRSIRLSPRSSVLAPPTNFTFLDQSSAPSSPLPFQSVPASPPAQLDDSSPFPSQAVPALPPAQLDDSKYLPRSYLDYCYRDKQTKQVDIARVSEFFAWLGVTR